MLEFTGERFLPGQGGAQIYYEHAHRYALASRYASGRRCVDVGSGEGYGAALLAQTASSVIGLDIDESAVRHAAERYRYAGLEFRTASAELLPLVDGSVDFVTCFETIEHVERPEGVVSEIARVLASDGIAFISTPDKAEYTDARPGFHNEFHLHEMYVPEFRALLERSFPHVLLIGQRLIGGSFLWAREGGVQEDTGEASARLLTPGDHSIRRDVPAMYVIAACSRQPFSLGPLGELTIFLDPSLPLLEAEFAEAKAALTQANEREARARVRLQEMKAQLDSISDALNAAGLRESDARRQLALDAQELELSELRAETAERELERALAEIVSTKQRLADVEAELAQVKRKVINRVIGRLRARQRRDATT